MISPDIESSRPRRAIVTGGGSARGIGIATAERLVRAGWTVGLTDLDADGLAANAGRLRDAGAADVPLAAGDVRSEADVAAAVATLVEGLGGVDALVNAAGISLPTKILETSLEEWENVFAVNVRGTFLVTKAVLPSMVAQRHGRIVNLSSVSGIRGGGIFGGTHYSASKAAVLGFTRAVARDFAHLDITVNAVAPSLIDTDLAAPHLSEAQMRGVLASIPAGRLGTPDDVAAVIAFLCTAESGYVTGEVVDINGGSHID
jgi:NAD(P)-dependent dehydrogenase (short-subunit alcohol dehydrogenase family)